MAVNCIHKHTMRSTFLVFVALKSLNQTSRVSSREMYNLWVVVLRPIQHEAHPNDLCKSLNHTFFCCNTRGYIEIDRENMISATTCCLSSNFLKQILQVRIYLPFKSLMNTVRTKFCPPAITKSWKSSYPSQTSSALTVTRIRSPDPERTLLVSKSTPKKIEQKGNYDVLE